jgi:Na+/phosphate symporter
MVQPFVFVKQSFIFVKKYQVSMRTVVTALLIAVIALIAELFAPWWTALLVAALIGFFAELSPRKAFLAGLLGIGLMWLGVAMFRDIPNDHILSARMAKLFSLPASGLYLAVTAVIGGLIGGAAAWSAAMVRGMKAQ